MSKLRRKFEGFKTNATLAVKGLAHGMKAADDVISSSNQSLDSGGVEQQKKLETRNLYAALLRGEITQEVKDLRYGMYKAAIKADEYDYIGNGHAEKKNRMLSDCTAKVENADGLKVLFTQWNHLIKKSISESMDDFIKGKESDPEHRLHIERKYLSRFKIEDFATQLVVKHAPDFADGVHTYVLDFYVPGAPLENDPKSIFFDKEVKTLYDTQSRVSDLIDFDNVSFVTEKAWPVEDLRKYSFKNLIYIKCLQFNGSYIFRFIAEPDIIGDEVAKSQYDQTSIETYEKKAPRKHLKEKNIFEIADEIKAKEAAEKENTIDIDQAKSLIKNIKKKNDKVLTENLS